MTRGDSKFQEAKPFVWTGVAWALAGVVICRFWMKGAPSASDFALAIKWMLGLWLLSVVDLVALAKTCQAVLRIAAGDAERQTLWAIQALYWGLIKLACLGFLAAVLMKQEIPTAGLLLGLATMVVIPLGGGFFWSRSSLLGSLKNA